MPPLYARLCPAPPRPATILFDESGNFGGGRDRRKVLAAVSGPDAPMPPSGPKLSAEAVARIRRLAAP